MARTRNNVAIIESSTIAYEGLSNILLKSAHHFTVYRVDDCEDLKHLSSTINISIVIMNPNFVLNKQAEFMKMKSELTDITWLALIYSHYDDDILNKFENTISINESPDSILKKLIKTQQEAKESEQDGEQLSEREIGVLIELVNGLSNKEVGEKLHISTHTVITHRKNIIDKTGIKSLSGLTIYAISKNIIKID